MMSALQLMPLHAEASMFGVQVKISNKALYS